MKSYLYTTMLSSVFIIGCQPTENKSMSSEELNHKFFSQKNSESQPYFTQASFENLMSEHPVPLKDATPSTSTTAKEYVFNETLTDAKKIIDIKDAVYFTTLDRIIHWKQNIANNLTNVPLYSVNTTENISSLPDCSSTQPIKISIIPSVHQAFQLSRTQAQVTSLDLQNVDVNIQKNLDTFALRIEKSKISFANDLQISTHTFYLGPESMITNGRYLTYDHNITKNYGMTMGDLTVQSTKRFPWAAEGQFIIAGHIDHLIVNPGMTVMTQGRSAKIDVLEQEGGTLKLSTDNLSIIDAYNVTANSRINVAWNARISSPLLQTKSASIQNQVTVALESIGLQLKIGDTLTLIQSSNPDITNNFLKDIATFGYTFKMNVSKDKKQLVLTLTNDNINAAGLSDKGIQIANAVLNESNPTSQKLSLMEPGKATATLNNIASDDILTPISQQPMNIQDPLDSENHPSSYWVQSNLTGENAHYISGFSFSNKTAIGISTMTSKLNQSSPIIGLHFTKNNLFLDGFSTSDGLTYGSTLGYKYGNLDKGYISAGMTVKTDRRSGACNTDLGYATLNHVKQTNCTAKITLKKRIENLDLGGQIFADIYADSSDYMLNIDRYAFNIPAHSLPLGYGIQLNGTMNFNWGNIYTGVVMACTHEKFIPTIEMGMNARF